MPTNDSSAFTPSAAGEPGEALLHLVYASTATRRFAEHDLPGLVERAREKNAEAGITAMLLYQEGTFLHALEGKESVVQTLFAKVAADERHDHVQRLVTIPVARRQFAGQPMGFHRFADEDVEFDLGEDDGIDLIYHHDHLSWRACLGLRLLSRFRTSGSSER